MEGPQGQDNVSVGQGLIEAEVIQTEVLCQHDLRGLRIKQWRAIWTVRGWRERGS